MHMPRLVIGAMKRRINTKRDSYNYTGHRERSASVLRSVRIGWPGLFRSRPGYVVE